MQRNSERQHQLRDMVQKQINASKTMRAVVFLSFVELILLIVVIVIAFREAPEAFTPIEAVLVLALALMVLMDVIVSLRIAENTRRLESNIEDVKAAFRFTENLNNTLRAQRHDFLNHLQVVYGLMEMHENDEAAAYIGRVYSDVRNVSHILRTKNPAINALLQAKYITCQEKGIAFDMVIESAMEELPVEPWQMCRVLSNLIDNSVEALLSDEADGHVTPVLRLILSENEDAYKFIVENTGPPIEPHVAERIFQSGYTTRGEGRGMGLFIVRNIVQDAGGSISYTHHGEWTSFCGMLPKRKRAA
ncbi:MAG: sensor histidine kinase [Christensenellales bacterium]|jgi:two-component system sensor histidine kinase AgrC